MAQTISVELTMPDDLAAFRLPPAIQSRLRHLLDKQDTGIPLTLEEQGEAEALVEVAELLTLLKMRSERLSGGAKA